MWQDTCQSMIDALLITAYSTKFYRQIESITSQQLTIGTPSISIEPNTTTAPQPSSTKTNHHIMPSFFPGNHSINWSGSLSNAYNTSSRRDSNIDPYSRTSSSIHRTSSSRYGDRSSYYSSGARSSSEYRDHRSGSRDAEAGASSRESDREGLRDGHGYTSSRDHESSYSRFARKRVERDRGYSGYSAGREDHRSSNYEWDRERATRRGATAGMHVRERSGGTYWYGDERESSSRRSRRYSERQATGGARQGERSGNAAAADWSGYRRSSAEGRRAFSPSEYYQYW
jgi:hypothetical protein